MNERREASRKGDSLCDLRTVLEAKRSEYKREIVASDEKGREIIRRSMNESPFRGKYAFEIEWKGPSIHFHTLFTSIHCHSFLPIPIFLPFLFFRMNSPLDPNPIRIIAMHFRKELQSLTLNRVGSWGLKLYFILEIKYLQMVTSLWDQNDCE